MRLDILVRNGLLGVALAGLITAGAAQAQDTDATKDGAKAEKVKKDKDRDPRPDNDKNRGKHVGEVKGKHKAKGHSH
jgi:Ni/Co efflux regulator RcnB